MKLFKITPLIMALGLALCLAACSTPSGDANEPAGSNPEIAELIAQEPSSSNEAAELYAKLMQKENDILSSDNALWEKVFSAANKDSAMIEDGGNYGDFLLKTIDSAEDKFSKKELKILRDGAEKIREIEGKLTVLEQKYPECAVMALDSDMSVPAKEGKPEKESDLMKFPAFEGKDLDGGKVKSDRLFSGNSVTVVNFWFTTCSPCVGELGELDKLNRQLAEKGGAVVGVNTFTLDGDKTAISEAKEILEKKKASYRNIWFASDSEAGKFTSGIYSYPTTYVVDGNGNIVGEPIVGAITGKKQAEKLQELIDQAIANSEQ